MTGNPAAWMNTASCAITIGFMVADFVLILPDGKKVNQ